MRSVPPVWLRPLSAGCGSRRHAAAVPSSISGRSMFPSDTAPPKEINFYDNRARSLAAKQTEPLSVTDLYAGIEKDHIEHARMIQEQLGIRIARRLNDFMMLPFIVGCNPFLKKVHVMYANAFNQIRAIPQVTTAAQEADLSKLFSSFLDDHGNVLSLMAIGCKECIGLLDRHEINRFMDRTMFSRIGIRLLVDHHLSLVNQKPGFVGCIAVNARLAHVARQVAEDVTAVALKSRGRAPTVRIEGQLDATFTYVTSHVEFILTELLKNAFRATLERFRDGPMPDVVMTLVYNDEQFLVRVSDQGGGFPASLHDKCLSYAFSSAPMIGPLESSDSGEYTLENSDNMLSGKGVGLPVARTYAEYFQGSLDLKSMYGYGVDAFLALNHLYKSAGHLLIRD